MPFNISVEKVEAYSTSDGKIFKTLEDASNHEYELIFDRWYVQNHLLGQYEGSYVTLHSLKEYIKENSEYIQILINLVSDKQKPETPLTEERKEELKGTIFEHCKTEEDVVARHYDAMS